MGNNEEKAALARSKAQALGDLLYEKQLAYGDSGAIALPVWMARLAQYRVMPNPDKTCVVPSEVGTHYLIPVELIAHLPRITRLDDRINRIISNPGGDRMGEDPWMDAAGDSIIGAIGPRFPEAPSTPCGEPECMRNSGHEGPHVKVDAAGRHEWEPGQYSPNSQCHDPSCIMLLGHAGQHANASGTRWGGRADERRRPAVAFGDDMPGVP